MTENDAPNLAPCPWCKAPPSYYRYVVKMDDHFVPLVLMTDQQAEEFSKTVKADSGYVPSISKGSLKDHPAERIVCVNTECQVRPRLDRVDSGDAVEVWNRAGGEKHD